jgi:hypothetical protein
LRLSKRTFTIVFNDVFNYLRGLRAKLTKTGNTDRSIAFGRTLAVDAFFLFHTARSPMTVDSL